MNINRTNRTKQTMYRGGGYARRVSGSGDPPLTVQGSRSESELCATDGWGNSSRDGLHCTVHMSDEICTAQTASDNAHHSTSGSVG